MTSCSIDQYDLKRYSKSFTFQINAIVLSIHGPEAFSLHNTLTGDDLWWCQQVWLSNSSFMKHDMMKTRINVIFATSCVVAARLAYFLLSLLITWEEYWHIYMIEIGPMWSVYSVFTLQLPDANTGKTPVAQDADVIAGIVINTCCETFDILTLVLMLTLWSKMSHMCHKITLNITGSLFTIFTEKITLVLTTSFSASCNKIGSELKKKQTKKQREDWCSSNRVWLPTAWV